MAKPISQEDKQKIVALYKQGLSKIEVQIASGFTQPTIRKVLSAAGYPPNEKREPTEITNELRSEIIASHNSGLSAGNIAKKFDIAKRTVLNILKESAEQLEHKGKGSVSPLEFIKAWQESSNADEVAAKTGLTHSRVYQRAHQYRAKGVPLKRYKFGNRYDWDELKEFAELFEIEHEDGE